MIISIESASTDCSLALAADDGSLLASDGWSSDRRQGHELLPRLLALVARQARTLADASAIAIGIGPGSFTGLRVGMAVAKGLAVALRVPIVGVPSLEAWLEAAPAAPAALTRAGAADAYLLGRGAAGPTIVEREAAAALAGAVAPAELVAAFGLVDAVPPFAAAGAVARRAAERLAGDPAGDDLRALEPAYLRAPRGAGQVAGTVEWH